MVWEMVRVEKGTVLTLYERVGLAPRAPGIVRTRMISYVCVLISYVHVSVPGRNGVTSWPMAEWPLTDKLMLASRADACDLIRMRIIGFYFVPQSDVRRA